MKFKKLIKSFADINHYTNINNIRSIKKHGLKPSFGGFLSAIPSEYDELSKSNYPKTQKEMLDIYNRIAGTSDESIPISIQDAYPLKYRQMNIMDGGGMSKGYVLDPIIRVKGKTKNDLAINRRVKAYNEGYDIDPRVEIRIPESNIDQDSLKFQVPKGMSDSMIEDDKKTHLVYLDKDGRSGLKSSNVKSELKKSSKYLDDIQANKDLLDMEDNDTKNNVKSIDAYKAGKFKSRGKVRPEIGKTNKQLSSKELRDRFAKVLFKYRHNDVAVNRLRDQVNKAQKDYYRMPKKVRNEIYGE